jgi:hypothetical protein
MFLRLKNDINVIADTNIMLMQEKSKYFNIENT